MEYGITSSSRIACLTLHILTCIDPNKYTAKKKKHYDI